MPAPPPLDLPYGVELPSTWTAQASPAETVQLLIAELRQVAERLAALAAEKDLPPATVTRLFYSASAARVGLLAELRQLAADLAGARGSGVPAALMQRPGSAWTPARADDDTKSVSAAAQPSAWPVVSDRTS